MSEVLLIIPTAAALTAAVMAWLQARTAHNEIGTLRRDLSARATEVRAAEEEGVDRLRASIDELRGALADTQRDLGRANAAIDGLTAAGEMLPAPTPPPLPRGRPARLDDLRRRLREAHSEPSPSERDDDEAPPRADA
ncbi:MAG: hypothetical protein NVSMB2_12150 [Chloroflexota bacterium]